MVAAVLVLLILGSFAGLGLGLAAKKFHVETDPRIEHVSEILPGLNCGACGYAGCFGYAEAIINEGVPVNGCPVGGQETLEAISEFLGIEADEREKRVAMVLCGGGRDEAGRKFHYRGIMDCQAAYLLGGGDKACAYGCIGYGSCVGACPFGAIFINEKGLAEVDREKCTGCEICLKTCPVKVIRMVPMCSMIHVLCNSKDKGPQVRKVCSIGCIGCMICQKNCPTGAAVVEDFLASIDYGPCTHQKICLEKCPTGCIVDISGAPRLAEVEKAEVES